MNTLRKKIYPLLFSLLLLFSTSFTVSATGSGNIDGGGGSMGQGTAMNIWHCIDGVRITVVTTEGEIVSTPFDLTNANISNTLINFGNVCKLQYTSGTSLSPSTSYSCTKPGTALPQIISTGGPRVNIEKVKRYFCSEYAAKLVAEKTGIPFEELIDGT